MTQSSSCPACGQLHIERTFTSCRKDFSLEGFEYAKCGACHSIYLDDQTIANQKTLTEYHIKYWKSSSDLFWSYDSWKENNIGSDKQNKSNPFILGEILRSGLNPDGIIHLDFGCGRDGNLVKELQSLGVHAEGCDPAVHDSSFINATKDYLFSGTIEDLDSEQSIRKLPFFSRLNKYNSISLIDVL